MYIVESVAPAMEAAMTGKESGQSDLAAWGIAHKRGVLDRIDDELDWRRFGKTLRNAFKAGRLSYPPLLPCKVLLLQQWHDLSDPMAQEAIGDRIFLSDADWTVTNNRPTLRLQAARGRGRGKRHHPQSRNDSGRHPRFPRV